MDKPVNNRNNRIMVRNKKGQFKGESGNPKGRPPGALSKVNASAREQLSDFYINKMLPSLKDAWDELSAYQKVKCTHDFSSFFVEKLRAESVDLNFDFDKLTEEQLDYIAYTVNEGSKKYDK